MRNKDEDEECWRVWDEPESEWGRLRRELIDGAPAGMHATEPQPSDEEVESVFRRVVASY